MAADELAAIIAELESLSERLSDLALDALREAVAAGDSKRPDLERQTTRARNAIERAIAILSRRERAAVEESDA